MTREQLERVGVALYGESWQSDLARALDVEPRALRHWIAPHDARRIPCDARVACLRLIAARVDSLQRIAADL